MKPVIDVVTLRVGALESNCYLIIDRKTKETLIIDPGDAADYIESVIEREKFLPRLIIATHGHFDHLLAVTELKLAYKIPFFINKNDLFLVSNMPSSAKHFLNILTDPSPQEDGFLVNGQKIKLGSSSFTVLETPGHTPGSISLYGKKEKMLFTGDLLFAGGSVGRTDFSYSSSLLLKKSVQKLLKLPQETFLYPGHGEKTTVREEKRYHLNLY